LRVRELADHGARSARRTARAHPCLARRPFRPRRGRRAQYRRHRSGRGCRRAQISKREIRAATLSALAPRRGETLWDIGSGSGSVAIEWLLADPSLRAIAVERRPDRAANIRRNAAAFGVPHLEVVEGAAPQALAGLPAPHAVFIGGGATVPGVIECARERLPSGGRLVINAVALETERVLLEEHAARGGSLLKIALARAAPIGPEGRVSGEASSRGGDARIPDGDAQALAGGARTRERATRMTGWYPAMPVTQWTWVKP
jgi:precorrin-6B C5,15-methyltransferase / cobalt-precorrin-6B C5,C15-methyltransferase